MPICPHCGSPVDEKETFCRSCGMPQKEGMPVTPRSPPSHPVNQPTNPPSSRSIHPAHAPHRPKSGNIPPVLVLVLIGIILILAVAAFFVFSGSLLSPGAQNSTGSSQGSGILPVIGNCADNLTRCSGKCVDLKTDQENCGKCGFSVPFGETCINGQFSSSSGSNTSRRTPVPSGTTRPGSSLTATTAAIAKGTSAPVVSTSAPVPVTPEISCSGRETLCGNSCVNPFTDKKNCGVCGRSCKSQEICVDARCGPACSDSDETLCDETCVDLETDMNNCGACGAECETFLPNAKGSQCTSGKCEISQCKTDYADCDKNIANGCEILLLRDASNCGSCGKKCATGQVCYNKKCSKPITS